MLRKRLPKSLYARVVLIVILPIFLMQSVITYVFFDRHWELVTANLSANVAGQIALVTRLYEENSSDAERRKVEAFALKDLELNIRYEPSAIIPSVDKRSLLTIDNATLDRELDKRLNHDFWFNTVSWPAYVEIRVQLDDGYLVFLPRRDRVFATSGPIFVVWLVGTSLLIGWIAIVFMRNQVRSILRLASAAEAFGRGRDAPDFRPTGATEVRRAGRAFIAMRGRIKRQMQQRTRMLAGVSHDLKTPLTRLKLALAMQPESADIQTMQQDALEMEAMLEGYLDFARDLAKNEDQADIDVASFVEDLQDDANRLGHRFGVNLNPPEGIGDDWRIAARRDALKRALTNLLANGFKYAARVWLTVEENEDFIEFIVDDDGPGIDPEQYEDVFRPFLRLDDARSQDVPGVGLGLSVVRDVARGHGGEIALARAPEGGLRATLRIPL